MTPCERRRESERPLSSDAVTHAMSPAGPLAPAASRSADLLVMGSMLSDVGLVRSINEDSVTFAVPSESTDPENRSGLLLVADGMGGHAAGEVASALAAEVVRRCFFELNGAVPDILSTAFAVANKAIFDYGQGHAECAGMGTTCTALAIRSDKIWLGHVGDSRAYLLRGGELRQLSEDQTLVAKMVREGTMTPAEARTSKYNNIILQALGTEPEVNPDIWEDGLPLSAGDTLVLCTDGPAEFGSDQLARLEAAKIRLIETPVDRLEGENGALTGVRFVDGSVHACEALFFSAPQRQCTSLGKELGAKFSEDGYTIDCAECAATNVPGLYVAGNTSRGLQLVIMAAAEGTQAAFTINQALLEADCPTD